MRRQKSDQWEAFRAITDAAERFVNRSPRVKRLEEERQELLDAIRQAQLVLSVRRLPQEFVIQLTDHQKRRRSASRAIRHKRRVAQNG